MTAGITASFNAPNINVVVEPEAAALAAHQRRHLLGLGEGSHFMIIDMGGGTVDMTIHEVGPVFGEGMELNEVTHRECLPEVGAI